MRAKIASAAKANNRTMTAEAVWRIEKSFEQESRARPLSANAKRALYLRHDGKQLIELDEVSEIIKAQVKGLEARLAEQSDALKSIRDYLQRLTE
jgi:hypothetical protein